MTHAPALPVLLPLIAAPLVMLLGRARAAWLLSLVTAGGSTLISFWLLGEVGQGGELRYAMGGWQPPVGIEYIIDALNAPILLIVSLAALVSLALAYPSSMTHLPPVRRPLVYALMLLCQAGLAGIAATADAFNVFVFLEISSLATYALVASGPQRGALLAAFQYLILGTLGGSFVLLGVGMIYQITGTLNMADLLERLAQTNYKGVLLAATSFLLLGFALKSALFPLHQWLPNAYRHAPDFVGVFLAAAATKVAIYAMLRFAVGVIGAAWIVEFGVDDLLRVLALGAVLYGAVAAAYQTSIRLMLAYSSISQLAYIVYALSLFSSQGFVAAYLQFMVHALVKGGLFIAVAGLLRRGVEDELGAVRGLAWRMPALFSCFLIGALALIGVPLTAGFLSKWHLLSGAWHAGQMLDVAVLVVASLITIVYVVRLLEPMLRAPEEGQGAIGPAPAGDSTLAFGLICAAAVIVLGIYTQPLVAVARAAARVIYG